MFKLLSENATMPMRATSGSAGYDLYAAETKTVSYDSGTTLIKTNVAAQCPPGTYGRIAIRSSLAYKQHLAVSAGVIDSDYYPNDIGVLVYCTKPGHSYEVKAGERFAQIVFEKIYVGDDEVITERTGGYGSTNERPSTSLEGKSIYGGLRVGEREPHSVQDEVEDMMKKYSVMSRRLYRADEDLTKHGLTGEEIDDILYESNEELDRRYAKLTPALERLMNGDDDRFDNGVEML